MKVIVVVVIGSMLSLAGAGQRNPETQIRKVTAKEVKSMIVNSTGPTIVNFWASWCGPCTREIPWFDSIIAAKKVEVKLLLVSLDSKSAYPNQLSSFVKNHGYKGEVVYLDDSNMQAYIETIEPKWKGAIPASIFVNNSAGYYQLYKEQIPRQRFGIELDKLMSGSGPQ